MRQLGLGVCIYICIYVYMYMYMYIYIYILFVLCCFSPSSTQHRDGLYEARGSEQNWVKPYVAHRHFGSEHCIHQHEPEQSHRGRAKREKKRERGGRTREKEKRGGKPRDHPGFFRACLNRPGHMNKWWSCHSQSSAWHPHLHQTPRTDTQFPEGFFVSPPGPLPGPPCTPPNFAQDLQL